MRMVYTNDNACTVSGMFMCDDSFPFSYILLLFYVFDFRNEWLHQIETHQSQIIPIDAVEKSKSWFEYLFNEKSPKESTYRCRICHKYYDEFRLQSNHKTGLAETKGMRKTDKAQNKRNILDHPSKPGHMKVIELLEKRTVKRLTSNVLNCFFQLCDLYLNV